MAAAKLYCIGKYLLRYVHCTPILKHKKLNVFSTSRAYLVKSVCFLTFYLVKSSKSTSQFLMYDFLCWKMGVCDLIDKWCDLGKKVNLLYPQ